MPLFAKQRVVEMEGRKEGRKEGRRYTRAFYISEITWINSVESAEVLFTDKTRSAEMGRWARIHGFFMPTQ